MNLHLDKIHFRVAELEQKSELPTKAPEPTTLSQAIATVTGAAKVYSEDKLPPAVPTPFQRWQPKRSADAPHDPFAYFPMVLYH
jgi:hypothetical protein